MAQLRRDHERFAERDVEVVIAGPDKAEAFRKRWAEDDLPFVGLPDPTHRVLKLYGQEVKLFKLGRMPAQVLVDAEGVVRYAHFGHSMKDIPPTEEMLALIDDLPRT